MSGAEGQSLAIDMPEWGDDPSRSIPVQNSPSLQAVLLSADSIAILICLLIFGIFSFIHPFERPFDVNDISISHPHLPDIVPIWAVMVAVAILPIITFGGVTRSTIRTVIILHSYVLGIAMTLAFTESAKIWVGRLRPDFLDRCKPVDDKCTGSAKSVEEGRKSFFSGHSSISFYGITYLVFWMLEEGWLLLGFYVGRRVTPGFVLLFSMIPLMLPAYVAISRSQQYIHHPTDIITGSLFGSLIAYVMVFYHYRYKK